MQSTTIPNKISIPFASSGGHNTIPATSQAMTNPGAASYPDGFPAVTRQPIASGGIPPSGLDMNGVLFDITSIQQFQSAGGLFKYDSAFASAVGGYPKGATLLSSDGVRTWRSSVEGNMTDPDGASAAGWFVCSGNSTAYKSGNGYIMFPSGIILQWGQFIQNEGANTPTSYSVTLPTTFPNATFQAYITPGQNIAQAAQPVAGSVENFTSSSISGFTYSGATLPRIWRFFAIGY